MQPWRNNNRATEGCERGTWLIPVIVTAVLGCAIPAAAQLPPPPANSSTSSVINTVNTAAAMPKARIIEWDLPSAGDANPGAMVVDTQGDDKDRNRLWFITRSGNPSPPRVYRMDFPKSLASGWAHWTAWQLSNTAVITGGADQGRARKVRSSKDRRFVYVRTMFTVERIDTQNCDSASNTCQSLVWADRITDPGEFDTSDLTLDDFNNVYWTHAVTPSATPNDPNDRSYVERMTPASSTTGAATVTRWPVGGGAGLCPPAGGLGSPCLSGVAVHPTSRNLIYYSEPFSNNIGELNVYTNRVRRWNLALLPPNTDNNGVVGSAVREPRQLHVDRWGKVWVVTGSGHLVSLDPRTNRLTRHQMPDQDAGDPFALGPDDDVVGYTTTTSSKVGVLFPKGQSFYIDPGDPKPVTPDGYTVVPDPRWAARDSGNVPPVGKTVAVQLTQKPDGTFIEAQLNTCPPDANQSTCVANDSMQPLGITPVKAKAEGTFFYAVGENTSKSGDPNRPAAAANRVGFVRFPAREKVKHPRDDDDENDGEGDHGQHGWHDHSGHHDADDDGVDDDNDHRDTNERNARVDDSNDDDAAMAPGTSRSYSIVALPTSLALIAISTPNDPLAHIDIEIYDALGMLVTRSVPTPGAAIAQVPLPAAGTYTCIIRNSGTSSVVQVPTLLVREPWTVY